MAMKLDEANSIVLGAVQKVANDDDVWSANNVEYAIQATLAWAIQDSDLLWYTDSSIATSVYTVTAASWSANVVTLTMASHTMVANDVVQVSSILPNGYNGTFIVTGKTSTTITYALTTDPGTYVSGGTISPLTVSFSGITGGFNRARHIFTTLDGANHYQRLEKIGFDQYSRRLKEARIVKKPEQIAFRDDDGVAYLYPIPDAAYTLFMTLRDIETDWAVPISDQSTITFKLPESLLKPIMMFGVPALIQHNFDFTNAKKDGGWAKMEEWLYKLKGNYGADDGADYDAPDSWAD